MHPSPLARVRESESDAEDVGKPPARRFISKSSSESSFQSLRQRAMSPTLLPFRFGGQSSHSDAQSHSSRWSKAIGSDGMFNIRNRRASTQSSRVDKGKDPIRGDIDHYSRPLSPNHGHSTTGATRDRSSFALSPRSSQDTSPLVRPSSRGRRTPTSPTSPTFGSSNASKKSRTSIILAASDVLAFRFGRRKHSVQQHNAQPDVLPDVIDITARRRDEEEEERNRLRVEAAQAIGLDPLLIQSDGIQPRHDLTADEDDDVVLGSSSSRRMDASRYAASNVYESQYLSGSNAGGARSPTQGFASYSFSTSQPPLSVSTQAQAPNFSAAISNSLVSSSLTGTPATGRYRSGSLAGHSRTNSTNMSSIPAFPSTVTTLTQYQQYFGILPKYYLPSSLRIFALSNASRNWKMRFIMLTSPAITTTRTRAGGLPSPAVSYLHLFKSSEGEEKELERLEINEESVVFVSDEEVGGRRYVVKVGGVDATVTLGGMRREVNAEEDGRTMWFLQIEDSLESQTWISHIKTSILNQRALRAGLLPAPFGTGVNEPRGDMDVMLSMRTQGFIGSSINSTSRQHHSAPPAALSQPQSEIQYASSLSSYSLHSQPSSPKLASPGPASIAVSTLNRLFSTSISRPRSNSRATSIDPVKGHLESLEDDNANGHSTGIRTAMRSPTPDVQSQKQSHVHMQRATSPIYPASPISADFDRKIIGDSPLPGFSTNMVTNTNASNAHMQGQQDVGLSKPVQNKPLVMGNVSLQPPPRKKWATSAMVNASTTNAAHSDQGNPARVTSTTTTTTTTPIPTVNSGDKVEPTGRTTIYEHRQLNVTTGSLGALTYFNGNNKSPSNGASQQELDSPISPITTIRSGTESHHSNYSQNSRNDALMTPETRARPLSLQSVSTYASGSNSVAASGDGQNDSFSSANGSAFGKNSGKKRNPNIRRWSRPGSANAGPPKTVPPSGPLPDIPDAKGVGFLTTPVSGSQIHSPTSSSFKAIPAVSPTPTKVDTSEREDRPASHASSRPASEQSQHSVVSSLPSFSKRASLSSVGTTNTSHSITNSLLAPGVPTRVGRSHRSSMPPPTRPASTSVLPPAPEGTLNGRERSRSEDSSSVPPNSAKNSVSSSNSRSSSRRHSFQSQRKRASFVGKGLRLSLVSPKPPPTTNLPPTPDEQGLSHTGLNTETSASEDSTLVGGKAGRKMSGGKSLLLKLNPIPASPLTASNSPLNIANASLSEASRTQFTSSTSPFPPPNGPLPPPPAESSAGVSGGQSNRSSTPSVLRHASLKQRLRILSTPTPSSTAAIKDTSASNLSATNNTKSTHTRSNSSSFISRLQQARSSLTNTPPPMNVLPSSGKRHSISEKDTIGEPTSFLALNSQPNTPIGEKITLFQNDPDFLEKATPLTTPIITPAPFKPSLSVSVFHPDPVPAIRPLAAIPAQGEITSLSPPPRRGSKQISVIRPLTPTSSPLPSDTKIEDMQSFTTPPPASGSEHPPSPSYLDSRPFTPPDGSENDTQRTLSSIASSRDDSVVSLGLLRM